MLQVFNSLETSLNVKNKKNIKKNLLNKGTLL